jgi:phosphoglucosamine mutase
LVGAITSGAAGGGVGGQVVGGGATPALAFLARNGDFAAGIMVSASHNPADDNGLKVLDANGLKLDDDVEDELEQRIWREADLGGMRNAELGRRIDARALVETYRQHRLAMASTIDAGGLHVVLDGANGSGGAIGRDILAATGATIEAIHVEPDGVNINVQSGATDPASLARVVAERGADVGFALDGDADRCIAVDANGEVVDGDRVLGILALERLADGGLEGGLVVSILSNGGLQQAVEAAGGEVVRTPVGDKYILEGMQVAGASLGGEKSGHVILLEHTTSGDGIVTALEILRVMTRRAQPLAELAKAIPLLPQQQRAVRVRHKDQWEGDPVLTRAIAEATSRLAGQGRVLVRPSGTEPALRVMVEGPDAALVSELADALATLAEERLH